MLSLESGSGNDSFVKRSGYFELSSTITTPKIARTGGGSQGKWISSRAALNCRRHWHCNIRRNVIWGIDWHRFSPYSTYGGGSELTLTHHFSVYFARAEGRRRLDADQQTGVPVSSLWASARPVRKTFLNRIAVRRWDIVAITVADTVACCKIGYKGYHL